MSSEFLWPGAWLTLKTLSNTLWPLNREWSWQHSQFLRCFMTIFDDIETIFDNWKDSTGDLTFEPLIKILTIGNLNSVNHFCLTIYCDTGQHSQFNPIWPLSKSFCQKRIWLKDVKYEPVMHMKGDAPQVMHRFDAEFA